MKGNLEKLALVKGFKQDSLDQVTEIFDAMVSLRASDLMARLFPAIKDDCSDVLVNISCEVTCPLQNVDCI